MKSFLVRDLLTVGVPTRKTDALVAGQPTPWLGLTERLNIYSFMLWVIVLTIVLLRSPAVERPEMASA